MEWDFVFINSECKLRIPCFSLFQVYYFLPNLKSYIIVDLISVCRKDYLKFQLFYDNTINTLSQTFSSLILNLMSLAPNPQFYICKEISCTWRLIISSICWTPITTAFPVICLEYRKKIFLHEDEETVSEPIEGTVRDLNLTEGIRVPVYKHWL